MLKISKLVISMITFSLILVISFILSQGTIFASDGGVHVSKKFLKAVDHLSIDSHFTLSPMEARQINSGDGIRITRAYHLYGSDNIFGDLLLAENEESNISKDALQMITRITETYPLITRDKFENGNDAGKILYREWGTATSDSDQVNYQNLVVRENNNTWYIIIFYKNAGRDEVDRLVKSVNLSI